MVHNQVAGLHVRMITCNFLPPCMFCGTLTAWKRPSPTHMKNAVCFDCIPKMSQLWKFAGLTEPKGD